MEEKTRPIYFKKPDGEITKLQNPAFLVGNGINYDEKDESSWTSLLISVLPQDIKEKISNEKEKAEYAKKDEKTKNKEALDKILKGLTYPEIAELADLSEEKTFSIKRQIANKINEIDKRNANNNKIHEKFVGFCEQNHIPILTTNFDHRLLSGLGIKKERAYSGQIETPHWFYTEEEKMNPRKISYRYPFRAYFAKERLKSEEINNEFAIWHIHGTKRYINSICINNVDYARNIAEIDKLIRHKNLIKENNWIGKHSWIDIFMKNDLVIVGFGLDYAETDIRWLLRERLVYQKFINQQGNQSRAATIYIYRKGHEDSDMPSGKKEFFDALDIDFVSMPQDDIYSLNKYLSTHK